ncbi:MAG: glycosyltransferase family 4 protein [Candidatus Omnitrophota bacterium]
MLKTNLLYVITKLELGGAQKQLLSLIIGLDKSKYNIFLYTAKNGLLMDEATAIIDVTIIKSRCLERAINPFKDLFCIYDLYLYIQRNKIQLVHTHSSKAGILGRIAAVLAGVDKIIHTVHGWPFHDYQPVLLKSIYILLERFCSLFTDKLIVVSDYDMHKGLKNYIGKKAKYCLISYGIDYSEFKVIDISVRRELGINSADLVVGMVACFKPQKCPQDFIKLAFQITRAMPEVKFILVGDGILRKQVEYLISLYNLKKNVVLTGWRSDIPRILSTLDVFVLTSLWEGLPITVLEAISAFKPVIATDTGGIKEVIIEGKTGFLVSPHHLDEMSQKLAGLLKNKDLRNLIAGNAFDFMNSRFSDNKIMVVKTQQLYYNLG